MAGTAYHQRSMCVTHVALGVPECPAYAATFMRDLTSHMDLVYSSKKRLLAASANAPHASAVDFSKLRAHGERVQKWAMLGRGGWLPAPCANASIPMCYRSFTAALK